MANSKRFFVFMFVLVIYFFISSEISGINFLPSILGSLFCALATNLWLFERQKINDLGKAFLESFKKKEVKKI